MSETEQSIEQMPDAAPDIVPQPEMEAEPLSIGGAAQQPAVDPVFGDKRATLEGMGETRVRHLLSQQMMPHHLIQPSYEWLTELDAKRTEKPDAAAQG